MELYESTRHRLTTVTCRLQGKRRDTDSKQTLLRKQWRDRKTRAYTGCWLQKHVCPLWCRMWCYPSWLLHSLSSRVCSSPLQHLQHHCTLERSREGRSAQEGGREGGKKGGSEGEKGDGGVNGPGLNRMDWEKTLNHCTDGAVSSNPYIWRLCFCRPCVSVVPTSIMADGHRHRHMWRMFMWIIIHMSHRTSVYKVDPTFGGYLIKN